jgi:hypothetical protein
MVTSDPQEELEIIWSPSGMTLDDLEQFTSLLVELHNEVAVPYVTEELYGPGSNIVTPESPRVISISLGSPLVIHLLAESGGVAILGMVGYILRHPDRLGGFLPSVIESWHRGWERALEAKITHIRAIGELNAQGLPIQTFERDNGDRGLTSLNRSGSLRSGY